MPKSQLHTLSTFLLVVCASRKARPMSCDQRSFHGILIRHADMHLHNITIPFVSQNNIIMNIVN